MSEYISFKIMLLLSLLKLSQLELAKALFQPLLNSSVPTPSNTPLPILVQPSPPSFKNPEPQHSQPTVSIHTNISLLNPSPELQSKPSPSPKFLVRSNSQSSLKGEYVPLNSHHELPHLLLLQHNYHINCVKSHMKGNDSFLSFP
jgi:hypothetical protein